MGGATNGVVAGTSEVVHLVALEGLAVALNEHVLYNHTGHSAVGLHSVDVHAPELEETMRLVDVEGVAVVEGVDFARKVRLQVGVKELH